MGMRLTLADSLILRTYGAAVASGTATCAGNARYLPEGVRISVVNRSLLYAEAYRSASLRGTPTARSPCRRRHRMHGMRTLRCTVRQRLDIAAKMAAPRELLA